MCSLDGCHTNLLRKHEKSTKHQLERPCHAWEDLWGTDTSIFETQAKASLVCWSFCQGAETRDPRIEADTVDPIGIRDRWLNPLTTRLRRLLPNLLPHLTCAKRVCAQELTARPACWPYIIKQRNFLKKKNLNDLINTLNAVSLISWHGITVQYAPLGTRSVIGCGHAQNLFWCS